MHEIIQQQLYAQYRLWYKIRTKDELSDYSRVTCNKCRKKVDKSTTITRKYGEQRKTFYYCPVCAADLKSPK